MTFTKKMRGILSVAVFTVMILVCMLSVNARMVFSDVPENHLYGKEIYTLVYDGILDGKQQSDYTYLFNPDKSISRSDFTTMLVKTVVGRDTSHLGVSDKFADVLLDHSANKYITYAAETGIVNAYDTGFFQPEKVATYAEAVKMLVCAKGYGYKYVPTNPWYKGYFDIAAELGITENISYEPQWYVTNVLAARLLYNFKYNVSIPKLYFTGDIVNLPLNKDSKNVSLKYESKNKTFESNVKIKFQGTSSLMYAKKNYTITFYTDSAYDEKMKVDMGWGPESKYCLKANWVDGTHARNVVTAKLINQMQKKTGLFENAPAGGAIDGFPVEVYANGVFYGLYTFNIPKDDWMFGMDSDNPNHIVMCGETWEDGTLFKALPDKHTWEIEVGADEDYAYSRLSRLSEFIMNSSDEEFKAHFHEYLSLDAVMNYYIMADFAYLMDNLGKNMLVATYDGNVWYPSLYDLDSSWGVNTNGLGLYSYEQTPVGFEYNRLFKRMKECFPKELCNRYKELRKDVLTKNNVLFTFKTFTDMIPKVTYAKELVKWGPEIPGYGLDQIEAYLDKIIPRLDDKYKYLEMSLEK